MVGDSLTMYGLWDEFWPDLEVVNRGIGSDVSAGLLARLDTIVACSPKKVFVMIGTNDVARLVPEDETVANVAAFVEGLLDALPDVEVYVQSVLPRTTKYTEEVESLNAALEEMVTGSFGDQVSYVNLYPLYVDEDGQIVSGLFASDSYHMQDGTAMRGRLVGPYAWKGPSRPGYRRAVQNQPVCRRTALQPESLYRASP